MAEVTVVIPNYNGIGYLKDCLDTLREQTCKNYETVLVDNGSTDGSLAFVKEHYPWVKILALDRNYGFCHAVNAGIRAAEGEFLLFTDSDDYVEPDYLEKMAALQENSDADLVLCGYHHLYDGADIVKVPGDPCEYHGRVPAGISGAL